MAKHMKRTELSELGEFGLIEHLTRNIKLKNPGSILGVGDDAAVLDSSKNQTIITTDMLIEGVHFDLTYTPLKHLGYKSVVVNLSDIYAMNAHPAQITVSIAVSSRFSLEAIEEFYEGILLACKKYNVDVIGGDTTSSSSGMVISITAIGEAGKNDIVCRNTAEKDDLLCVSGDLGAAYAGLLILEREKEVFKDDPEMQPDLKGYDYVLGRQLKPEARRDIIKLLKDLKVKPTSMIDISDGLSSESLHICNSSGVGCNLYEEKIPINPATITTAHEFKLDPTVCALSGGEDYELLLTVSLADYDKIKDNPKIKIIGHITEKEAGANLVAKDGSLHPLIAQGWDALLRERKKDKKKKV